MLYLLRMLEDCLAARHPLLAIKAVQWFLESHRFSVKADQEVPFT
jgi:hypothetical protein